MAVRKPSKPAPKSKTSGNTNTRSTAAAAKSSAKSTASGPTHKGGAITDAATAKVAGTEAVAGAMPYNASKPGEIGKAAMTPPTG